MPVSEDVNVCEVKACVLSVFCFSTVHRVKGIYLVYTKNREEKNRKDITITIEYFVMA